MLELGLRLHNAPALLTFEEDPERAARRGTVLILHGLSASKETQRPEATALAARGFLAVSVDAVGHGERRYGDFEDRFAHGTGSAAYLEVVRATAEELPEVAALLIERGLAAPGRLGGCGISMGGAILFGAMTSGLSLEAAATIVASPRWPGDDEASPHRRLERYAPTALLIQTAAEDAIVPPLDARALHQALVPGYALHAERLRYIEHPGEGHILSEAGWRRLWAEVVSWFERHLPRPTE